jgi:hypothetical protein
VLHHRSVEDHVSVVLPGHVIMESKLGRALAPTEVRWKYAPGAGSVAAAGEDQCRLTEVPATAEMAEFANWSA